MTRLPLFAVGLAAALAWAPALPAQEDVDALKEMYQHKLELPFLKAGGWSTDFDQARALAKEQGKLVFVYFSRSYSP